MKTEFRKELNKKRDEYETHDEKRAFLDGVEWMLDRDIKESRQRK